MTTKPVTKPTPKPVTKPTPKPVTKPATKPVLPATKSALVTAVLGAAGKAYELKTDEQIDLRADIINAAYTTAKADHALKNKVFVYYVTQIKKRDLTVEHVQTFFRSEIDALFAARKLKETATNETTQEKVDARTVYAAVRRMLSAAAERFDRAAGTSTRGADQDKDDPLATPRNILQSTSLENLGDAFWQIKSEKRKEDIIKALFSKLAPDAKAALYLELEAMTNA